MQRLWVLDRRGGLAALAFLAFVLAGGPAGAVSLVVNGSFEDGADPGNFVRLSAGSTAINGWEIVGTNIDYIGTVWQASDGTRSIDLEGNAFGAVRQIIETVSGQEYLVSFDMSGNPVVDSIKTLSVTAAGQSEEFTFDSSLAELTDMAWETHVFTFTANSTSTTLEFAAAGDHGSFGPALDNVSMEATPPPTVPEPTTALLLVGGLLGLGSASRFGRGC